MSSFQIQSQMVLLPKFTVSPTTFTCSASSPSAADCTFIFNNNGVMQIVRSGGATINGLWMPYNFGGNSFPGKVFEVMLTTVSGVGFTNTGVWRDSFGGSLSWDGLSFADASSVMRMDVRLKSVNPILATQTFNITWDIV